MRTGLSILSVFPTPIPTLTRATFCAPARAGRMDSWMLALKHWENAQIDGASIRMLAPILMRRSPSHPHQPSRISLRAQLFAPSKTPPARAPQTLTAKQLQAL
ncbi:MAG TPA: hypothetical protein VM452_16535 [Caulifigura sp.]|nr:hypothetical protein [Caulifigura sp.]